MQRPLYHPLKRPSPKYRIIALISKPLLGPLIQLQANLATCKALQQTTNLNLDNPGHIFTRKAIKNDGLVQAVQELGAEMAPHRVHHIPLGLHHVTALW